MARICLLTPGQPSINPRIVKEADALYEAGHEVHLICSHYVSWADEADRDLLRSRRWSCTYVGGDPKLAPVHYYWTRSRHGIARRIPMMWNPSGTIGQWALSRVLPELMVAAVESPADLYIAHYTGALVAAAAAANKHNALLAFDAEDLVTGYYRSDAKPSAMDLLVESVERRYLPMCCYVTAASPGIAEAYAVKYEMPLPISILNVFPLGERPKKLPPATEHGPLQLYWFSQTIGLGRGLEDIIQAMGRLKDCEIELHLRGRWSTRDRDVLLGLATSVGVDVRRIRSYPPSPSGELVRLAATHDVGLALEPRDSDNHDLCISNKILTYMLAGNAIIATSTRGQRMIMETIGGAGFLYEPGDIDRLSSCLRLWCQYRNVLQEARRQSWHWGTHQFNWDLEKKKFLCVIELALGKK